jgi:glucose/arabinose dehydrogenase
MAKRFGRTGRKGPASRRANRAFVPGDGAGESILALEGRQLLATLPPGFGTVEVASGLSNPTAMAVAPDGRVFIAQQDGQVRVVQDGQLLPDPVLAVPVTARDEQGLAGLALDPDFEQNGYIYVDYTTAAAPVHNQVSRFTVVGNTVVPGSQLILYDADPPEAHIHVAGALGFGPDNKLYIAVGDGLVTKDLAQSLGSTFGKILRINPDGTIPTDNPFYDVAQGQYRAIWAYGLRNPFTLAFQPGTARMYINDVGLDNWEEVNVGAPGANYGWPLAEGPTDNPLSVGPIHAYPHAGPDGGCAITGGTFYNPAVDQFPSEYVGSYFFIDLCNGKLSRLDPQTGQVSTFAEGLGMFTVGLVTAPDGSLYYLTRDPGVYTPGDQGGALHKVEFPAGAAAPHVLVPPRSQIVPAGSAVAFTVDASGRGPLSIQWQRNGQNIPGANGPVLYLPSTSMADNGAVYQAVVANASGLTQSPPAYLGVVNGRPPQASIQPVSLAASPRRGRVRAQVHSPIYDPGELVTLNATATRGRGRGASPVAFSWHVDIQAPDHARTLVPETAGIGTLQFALPTSVPEGTDAWYRVYLTAASPSGLKSTTTYDIYPSNSPLATLYALQHPTPPGGRRR